MRKRQAESRARTQTYTRGRQGKTSNSFLGARGVDTMTAAVSSAAGFLTLLEESDNRLKVHALTQIDRLVADYWTEIANSVTSM